MRRIMQFIYCIEWFLPPYSIYLLASLWDYLRYLSIAFRVSPVFIHSRTAWSSIYWPQKELGMTLTLFGIEVSHCGSWVPE